MIIASKKEKWTYFGIGGTKKQFIRAKGEALDPERQSTQDLKKLKELVENHNQGAKT